MKIENYLGTANTFTFPHNPQIYDEELQKFIDQRDYPYNFSYFGTTQGIRSKRNIVLNGHFDGTTRNTDFQTFAGHINDPQLKKLYFSTDKFYICIPKSIKRTLNGQRVLFVDYVANLISPFGILFSDTQKSGGSGSTQANAGNVYTPIEKITGTVTSGNLVTIKDGLGNGFTINPTASGTLTVYLIYMTNLGNDMYITEYLYADVNGTKQRVKQGTTNANILIGLNAGQTLSNLFSGGTIGGTTPTFYFRDGYSGD